MCRCAWEHCCRQSQDQGYLAIAGPYRSSPPSHPISSHPIPSHGTTMSLIGERSPLNCRLTLSGSTTQEIVVVDVVVVVVASSMWLRSCSASSVAYKPKMWWSRKLASRCLRLHRAKSTRAPSSAEPEQTLGIIGVPFAKGQGKQGVELAPDLLRQSSLRQVLQSSHGEWLYWGDIARRPLEGENHNFPLKKGEFKSLVAKLNCFLYSFCEMAWLYGTTGIYSTPWTSPCCSNSASTTTTSGTMPTSWPATGR